MILEITAIATSLVAVGGFTFSLWHNGATQREGIQEMKTNQFHMKENQRAIISKLDDASIDRKELRKEITDMKENCARISTGLNGRIKGLEYRAK